VVDQIGQPPSKKEANDAREAKAEGNQNASKDKKTVVAQIGPPLKNEHKSRKIVAEMIGVNPADVERARCIKIWSMRPMMPGERRRKTKRSKVTSMRNQKKCQW